MGLVHECAVCGSQWFREVDVYRVSGITRPAIVGNALICLCGTPILLGNFPPAPASNAETLDHTNLLRQFALLNEYDAVAARLPVIEHQIGRRVAAGRWQSTSGARPEAVTGPSPESRRTLKSTKR
jgi:hypothetical protein